MSQWCVYMLRCRDGSLYTGYTNDMDKRLEAHNNGKLAAKYTRSRRPVTLVYREQLPSRSAAMKRECALKKLSKAQKEALLRQA
jgi:putative endonuclease